MKPISEHVQTKENMTKSNEELDSNLNYSLKNRSIGKLNKKMNNLFNANFYDRFFSFSFDLGFIFLLIFIFGTAGGEKLYKAEVPEWFLRQFEKTIFDCFPGMMQMSFWMIAIMELVSALILTFYVAAFFIKKRYTLCLGILNLGLWFSFLTFILLSIGQRVTGKFNDSAILVFYAFIVFVFYKMQNNKNYEKV